MQGAQDRGDGPGFERQIGFSGIESQDEGASCRCWAEPKRKRKQSNGGGHWPSVLIAWGPRACSGSGGEVGEE